MSEFVEIPERLAMFWRCWNDLGSSRQQTFSGAGSIPWTAVDAYARRFRFSDEEFEIAVVLCRELDVELMEYHGKMAEQRG